ARRPDRGRQSTRSGRDRQPLGRGSPRALPRRPPRGPRRMPAMTPIRIEQITKRFGTTVAVDDVSLRIEPGELFFLLGPSGCGKTTLLRLLAGFEQPDDGDLYFGDQRITHLPPRARDAGMVFQTYALWPHLTVARNVAYGLQVRGTAKAEAAKR